MPRYPEILRMRVPTAFAEAMSTAGKRRHTSGPEWLRQVALRAMEKEGIFLRVDGRVEERELALPAGAWRE
jgi:hypothetical protein